MCIVEVLLRRLATSDFCHLPNSHDMNKLTVGCLQNLWSGQLEQSQVMFGMWSQEATLSRGCRDLCWRRPWAQGCQTSKGASLETRRLTTQWRNKLPTPRQKRRKPACASSSNVWSTMLAAATVFIPNAVWVHAAPISPSERAAQVPTQQWRRSTSASVGSFLGYSLR